MNDHSASAALASAAPSAVAGAGAIVLSSLGIEPGPLFWALIGATIGMTWAAAMPRPRAIIVFVCVTFVCSLFGAWLSVKYASGEQISRNAFSCVLAVLFHPIASAMVAGIPTAINSWLTRKSGGQQP